MNTCQSHSIIMVHKPGADRCVQVIRHQHGFKIKPFEWLYHGLEPLLLPDVLTKKWGIPLTLSVVYTCVALRLGVPLMPHKVRHTPPGDCCSGYLCAFDC